MSVKSDDFKEVLAHHFKGNQGDPYSYRFMLGHTSRALVTWSVSFGGFGTTGVWEGEAITLRNHCQEALATAKGKPSRLCAFDLLCKEQNYDNDRDTSVPTHEHHTFKLPIDKVQELIEKLAPTTP